MSARATTPTAADEALAYLRSVRARQVAAPLGRVLSDGSVLFGSPVTVWQHGRQVEVLPLPTANDRAWRLSDAEMSTP